MKDDAPKVTLISPCYNGEQYIRPFLDSLCQQDYSNVEFIFVNDGSTDKTEDVFMSYKPQLEEKGWTVLYIKQENAGQAAAINQGLKIFTGKYLIFPDSDDILYSNHISEKVKYMEKHPQYGIAYCNVDYVPEENLESIFYTKSIYSTVLQKRVFEGLIKDKNVLWEPIGNIVRASVFLEVVPDRHIYEGRGGQNCQIQMPLVHKHPYGCLNKSLCKYVIRASSHCRTASKDYDRRIKDFTDIYLNTITSLTTADEEEKKKWIEKVKKRLRKNVFEHKWGKYFPLGDNVKQVKLFGLLPILKIKNGKYYLFGIFLLLTVK